MPTFMSPGRDHKVGTENILYIGTLHFATAGMSAACPSFIPGGSPPAPCRLPGEGVISFFSERLAKMKTMSVGGTHCAREMQMEKNGLPGTSLASSRL
jgi:hypothetical protein